MEFILGCGAIALILGIIAGVVWLGFVFPLGVKNSNKQKYNISGVSVVWAIMQAVFAIGLFVESTSNNADNFAWVLLGFLAVFGFALFRCVKKCKQVNMPQNEIVKTCVAQCCLVFGIVIVILAILVASSDKSKRRRNLFWDWL